MKQIYSIQWKGNNFKEVLQFENSLSIRGTELKQNGKVLSLTFNGKESLAHKGDYLVVGFNGIPRIISKNAYKNIFGKAGR